MNFLSVSVDAIAATVIYFYYSLQFKTSSAVCVCVPFVFSLNELLRGPDYCTSINGKQIFPCMDSHTTSGGFYWRLDFT